MLTNHKKFLYLILSLFVCLITASLSVIAVQAANTNTICDDNSPSKYYCSYVGYSSAGSGWTVNSRNYKGARDGGATRWQLLYYKDWQYVGGQWQQINSGGPSAYFTNITFGSWSTIGSPQNIPTSLATVTLKFQFLECNPTCYAWCSYLLQHDLSNGYAYRTGQTTCL